MGNKETTSISSIEDHYIILLYSNSFVFKCVFTIKNIILYYEKNVH